MNKPILILVLLISTLSLFSCIEEESSNSSSSQSSVAPFATFTSSTSHSFSLPNDGKVIFQQKGGTINSARLFDSDLNEYIPTGYSSNNITFGTPFTLEAGSYKSSLTVRTWDYAQIVFFSPQIHSINNLRTLSKGTYKGNGTSFYKFTTNSDTNILISSKSFYYGPGAVKIFDQELNEYIPTDLESNKIDTGSTISIQAGTYIIMLELDFKDWAEVVVTY
jgi:hypothetical protein